MIGDGDRRAADRRAADRRVVPFGRRHRWLPAGKMAAVCFSVDDIHPGTSQDDYEAGGDLDEGSLGRLRRLQQRQPKLKATLCVTPDWRLKSLLPDTRVWRHVPWLKDRVHWTTLHPEGHFRLDRHPRLVGYLNALERCEVVLHGVTHSHQGPRFAVEFQSQSTEQCAATVQRGLEIFQAANIRFVRGFVPPAWNAPDALISALNTLEFQFLCSARDVRTAIASDSVATMSGLQGVSLIYPELISDRRIVHLSCNFQATSPIERALHIIELGGVLHIKAHIFKTGGGHVMLDGLDAAYCNYLDVLLRELDRRFGARLWWAHLSEVAARARMVS